MKDLFVDPPWIHRLFQDDITTSNSAERYDPALKRWINVSPMSTARSDFGCVAVDHHIYVIGGFNGTVWTNLCEK